MSKCKCASNGNEFNPSEPKPSSVETIPYKRLLATPKPRHTKVEKSLFDLPNIMGLSGNIVNIMIFVVVMIVMFLLLYKP